MTAWKESALQRATSVSSPSPSLVGAMALLHYWMDVAKLRTFMLSRRMMAVVLSASSFYEMCFFKLIQP